MTLYVRGEADRGERDHLLAHGQGQALPPLFNIELVEFIKANVTGTRLKSTTLNMIISPGLVDLDFLF